MSHSFTHRIMSHPNSNIFKYYDIWFIYLSEKWFQVQEFFIFQEFWKTINIIITEAYLFSRKLVNKMDVRPSPFWSSKCGRPSVVIVRRAVVIRENVTFGQSWFKWILNVFLVSGNKLLLDLNFLFKSFWNIVQIISLKTIEKNETKKGSLRGGDQ